MPETQCVALTAGPMEGGSAPVGPGAIGPGLCAMFEAVEDGYASGPGPPSLGPSQPSSYTYPA
jgi:hypothetical protein